MYHRRMEIYFYRLYVQLNFHTRLLLLHDAAAVFYSYVALAKLTRLIVLIWACCTSPFFSTYKCILVGVGVGMTWAVSWKPAQPTPPHTTSSSVTGSCKLFFLLPLFTYIQ